jgi:hypothetical protein
VSEPSFWSDLTSSAIAGLAAVGAAWVLDTLRSGREAERARADEVAREARREAADAARLARDADERKAEAGRRAILASWEMRNSIVSYINKTLDPLRHNGLRHLMLPPVRIVPCAGVNVQELVFLMDGDHDDLLSQISLNNKNYQAVVGNVDSRSDFRAKDCHDAAVEILRGMDESPSYEVMEKWLPRPIVEKLKDAPDSVYERADQLAWELESTDEALHIALAQRLPGHGFDGRPTGQLFEPASATVPPGNPPSAGRPSG